MDLIRTEQLVKTYRSGEGGVLAVRGVDFAMECKCNARPRVAAFPHRLAQNQCSAYARGYREFLRRFWTTEFGRRILRAGKGRLPMKRFIFAALSVLLLATPPAVSAQQNRAPVVAVAANGNTASAAVGSRLGPSAFFDRSISWS